MRARFAVLATTAVALTCSAPLGGAALAQQPEPAMRPAGLENALLKEMNRVRAAHGLRSFRSLAKLRRPARAQSRYLLRIGELRHESSDGSPFWTRLVAAGFSRRRTMGENLALVSGCGRSAARRTVRMWLASPGHRANLLNPRYRFTGAGVAIGRGCSVTYLTADYGG